MKKSHKQIIVDLSLDGRAYATEENASGLLKAVGINFFRVAKLRSGDDVVLLTNKEWETERGDPYRANEINEFEFRNYGKVVLINKK